jgi:AcrR family transcriptional regulator
MSRYREEDRERAMRETRGALLEAAAEEFAREGYEGANINQISKAAGYAKGTVYNDFESKRALMKALIEDTAALHLEYIANRVGPEGMAGRRLDVFFEAGFDFVSDCPARAQTIVNNLYGPDASSREEMFQAYVPMFELVGREVIGLGVEQGVFRSVDPTTTANLVMLIYLGIASQVSPEGRPWLDAKFVADFATRALRS